jgi:hypothetical protein
MESDALEAGEGFVVVLPVDTSARTAQCAVVARFANGLSERKPVSMSWKVIDLPDEAEVEEAGDKAPEKDAPDDNPKPVTE